VNIVDTVGS